MPLTGCTSSFFLTELDFSFSFFFLFHLFSAVCGWGGGEIFHSPHIYNSLQGCSSIPGCQTIQMRHHRSSFPAHHRVMYALSHCRDWHCREASWPVEEKNWLWHHQCHPDTKEAHTPAQVCISNKQKEKYSVYICTMFCTYPVRLCRTKAYALFSPYVLLKWVLFDLKLIGRTWAWSLKARTAGVYTRAHTFWLKRVRVSLFVCQLASIYLSISVAQSGYSSLPLSMLCCPHFLPLSIS